MNVTIAGVNMTPDLRLKRPDAAAYLGISAKTLANYKIRGKGPRCIKVAGRCFYYLADLEAFVRGETLQ